MSLAPHCCLSHTSNTQQTLCPAHADPLWHLEYCRVYFEQCNNYVGVVFAGGSLNAVSSYCPCFFRCVKGWVYAASLLEWLHLCYNRSRVGLICSDVQKECNLLVQKHKLLTCTSQTLISFSLFGFAHISQIAPFIVGSLGGRPRWEWRTVGLLFLHNAHCTPSL